MCPVSKILCAPSPFDVIKQWFFSISLGTGLGQASLGVLWCLDGLNYACSPASKLHPVLPRGLREMKTNQEAPIAPGDGEKPTRGVSGLSTLAGAQGGPSVGTGRRQSIRDKRSLAYWFLVTFLGGNACAVWAEGECSRSARGESRATFDPSPSVSSSLRQPGLSWCVSGTLLREW